MSEVRLYDSRGYPLDDPNGERNEKIRNMGRYGVVFTISYTLPYEMVTYFRAYESASGRMEQYYATYTTSSNRALLREFREAVIDAAENDHDLEIERSTSGENILSNLDADDPGQIGSPRQRSRARELLAGGERLRFGVGSYEKAFKLIGELAGARAGMEFAVTEGDSTHAGPMSTYDLVVEKGAYVGLEPLGETDSLMNPEPETTDDGPVSDESMELLVDVGYGVAAVVLLVALYGSVAYLVWMPPGFVPMEPHTTALPGVAEIPGTHGVTIDVTDSGGQREVALSGYSPADQLTVQFVNDTNSTTVVDTTTVKVQNKSSLSLSAAVPANATGVRVKYPGLLSWKVAPESGLKPFANNNSVDDDQSTSDPAGNNARVTPPNEPAAD